MSHILILIFLYTHSSSVYLIHWNIGSVFVVMHSIFGRIATFRFNMMGAATEYGFLYLYMIRWFCVLCVRSSIFFSFVHALFAMLLCTYFVGIFLRSTGVAFLAVWAYGQLIRCTYNKLTTTLRVLVLLTTSDYTHENKKKFKNQKKLKKTEEEKSQAKDMLYWNINNIHIHIYSIKSCIYKSGDDGRNRNLNPTT